MINNKLNVTKVQELKINTESLRLIADRLNIESANIYIDLLTNYLKGGDFFETKDEIRQQLIATESIFKTFGIKEGHIKNAIRDIRTYFHGEE